MKAIAIVKRVLDPSIRPRVKNDEKSIDMENCRTMINPFNEYLRILEHGHRIRAVHVESDVISVDTVDDLEYARKSMRSDPWLQKYDQSY